MYRHIHTYTYTHMYRHMRGADPTSPQSDHIHTYTHTCTDPSIHTHKCTDTCKALIQPAHKVTIGFTLATLVSIAKNDQHANPVARTCALRGITCMYQSCCREGFVREGRDAVGFFLPGVLSACGRVAATAGIKGGKSRYEYVCLFVSMYVCMYVCITPYVSCVKV